MANEIVKKDKQASPEQSSERSSGIVQTSSGKSIGIARPEQSSGGLHSRIAAASQKKTTNFVAEDLGFNRIKLLLDCSGSMGSPADRSSASWDETKSKSKMDFLHEAVEEFLKECSWLDTSVGFVTFGLGRAHEINFPVSDNPTKIKSEIAPLSAEGGTPLAEALAEAIKDQNAEFITRAIIISDGEANDPASAESEASQYKELLVPVDCVHIGSDTGGEDLLRKIAELTGGIFLKFTNVANFKEAFKYLTPRLRKQLALPGAAKLLGATEIKTK